MWITRAVFDALNAERIAASEAARILSEENRALHITEDWLRLRVEQIERERAQLLFTYMGIKVGIPVVVKSEPSNEQILSDTNPFRDIGDKRAKGLGIDWDADGVVKQ